MEPVEINAGAWYLRALRADDRPALAEVGETDVGYTAHRAAQWESDAAYSWAVCEPTTGELLAEIILDPITATVRSRARSGHADAAAAAKASVRRFAGAVLGINVKP
jgi:hypothetical protein